MGIRGKKAAARRKTLWKGLWASCGKERELLLLSPLSLLSTVSVHRSSTAVDTDERDVYPSVIFLRMSSRFRLNSPSSFIMVSILPQAEMAVVWSVRSKRMAILL